ncbi:MAG: Gfo/Idh/MocA family oxidoreductase [Hyphomicrobiales bacterium]|nr:Gfo/Idh/MocA family oxidoreductase [Hyphomicrobiales bacterium]
MPLAVVGSGAIADYYYFPVLAANPHLSANTWIVEPALDRGVKAAEKFGFRKDQLVGRIEDLPPAIRIAVNATPSHLHRGTTVALIERDISVLVEKPFAETAEDARAMIAAAQGRAILTANHFRRLTPSYAFVRDFIASGQLGEVKKITWAEGHKFDWPTQSGFNFRRPWPNGRPRGALLDIGVHIFDIICWWLDAQPRVNAAVMDGYGGPEAFVHTNLSAGDVEIDVSISFLNKLANAFSVEGTRATIRGVTSEFARLEIATPDGVRKTVAAPGNADRADIARRMVTNFLEVVAGSGSLLIEASSVVPPLAVIDDIYATATDYLPVCYQEWVA